MHSLNKAIKFTIVASPSGLKELQREVDELATPWDLSQKQLFEIHLILEEICTNYIEHSAADQLATIDIQLQHRGSTLTITTTDTGPEFDPTAVEAPDTRLPMEEREAGGLGLHLVRHFTESITYSRKAHTNTLVITKDLTPVMNAKPA